MRPHGAGVREEGVHLPAAGGSPDDERGRNYVITPEDEDEILKGGPITRARNNIEAIKVLKQLEEEGRPATVKEQKKLVKFSGWGSIYQIFEPWKHSEYRTWAELNKELRSLLTDKEYYAASRATQNAHYTSPEVIRAMWEALGRFGFDGGRILEPALGAGHFFGLMPPGMAAKSKLVGVELDQITGKIARFLYPEANVYVQGFEETVLPDNFFDVAISNVPFGDIQIADSSYPRYLTNKIHNYFFVKALDKVRPGGLIVFITSTGTMDARTNRDVRKYLASKADFIGAVRLPGSTFREVAKTDVTTDIIVLKKRTEGQEPSGEAWIESKESGLVSKVDGKPLYINEYFTIHPEMVLGKLAEDKLHTGRIGVELDGRDIAQALKEAFERLPEGIYEKAKVTKRPAPDKEILEGKPEIAEGTFVVRDGKVYQSVDGNLVRVEKNEAKIKGIIGLRDAALEVLKVQYNGEPDEVLKEVQGKLNKLYDEFVRKYGPIHQNLKLFEKDPHHYLLDSLEEKKVDPRTKKVIKVKKADIFTQRTIRAFQREFKAETPKEALLVSLNEEGRINWQRIAQLTGRTEEELQKELEGLVFKNPEGDWETAEEYLSGNVRMKLKVAEAAAEVDPQYRKNVEALKKVQPRDLEPHEITATLGAPWIPEEYVQEFINSHILNSYDAVRVIKKPFVNLWKVELKKAWEKNSTRNTRTWGTPRAPATALIELTLNKKTPVIYDRVKEGDTERRVINQRETDAARQKQLKLEEEFNRWFWSDPERAKVMAAKYNEIYNSLRLTSYDGSHLTFPGMNTKIQLHPHQKNAVWRIISSPGNTLVAHGVGKGKTFTMAAAIMELRRLGLAKKPMIVVPNNLLEQWPVEFKKLYPQAKVLVLTSRDLPGVFADKKKAGESDEAYEKRRNEHAQKRKAALSRIITGDWDAVIIPTHLFTRLPVSPEWERAFIEEQVRELRAVLTDLKKERDRSSRSTVKQLEKTLQNFEAKLKLDINEIKRDIVMPFEELGIDWLFVDEAHYFKNLGVTTRMSRVGGIPTSESQRALDMFMKTQWITKLNNGKGVVFATGTPITNTMAEMYNLQRYLTPDDLKELGVSHFDDWATMFGTIQTAWEISADGRTYQQKNSFRKFINLAELLKQFRSFADVVLNEQGDPGVPKLKNNKRTIITVEPSPEQEELIQQCADRLASFKHGMYDPKVDNPLKVCVDGQKIALDPRLVDPSLPENPNSKVNKAIANIYDIWQKTKDKKSTQLVFLDLSVPKSKADFEVEEETALSESEEAQENIIIYKEIKKKLISLGVPAEEIAFVHEFNTNAKKKQLNDAMNEGRIRILIGSTGKMGLGLNIQRKLIALHHLDCPWRPDELEQREGRILRQGNENEEVEIFVYGTERSFDTMRWNKVAQKARFIRQALVAGDDIRQMEDIDEVVLSYEEAKAAVSGNPLVEEKFKVDTEVARLQMARTHYLENRNQMFRKLNSLEDNFMPRLTRFLEDLKKDLERKKDVSGDKFAIEILGRTYTDRKEANEALKEALKKLPKATPENPEVREEVGSFAGFNLFIRKTLHDNMWELVGNTRLFNLFSENPIRSMEAQLGSIKNEMRRTEESIKKTEEEIAELQKEIDKPWEDQEKLNELLVRQREINLQLGITDVTTEEVGEDVPTEDETYPLTALDELRGKADVALANRVKGTPREKDVYALPLFAPQKTSVKQVARGLRLAVEREIFKKGMVVVDVGGGLYDRGTQYLAEHGITNLVYDPYARPEEHNNSILQQIKARGGADAVALNNVLNVIPKAEERADVLRFSYGLLKNGGQMVVTVYEGNRSGKGSTREFKDGTWSWQENRRLESYEKEIRAALPEGARIEKTSGAFVVTKPADEKALNIYALAERKKAKKIVTVDPIEEPSKLSPKATREISERLTRALNTAARSTRMGRRLAGMRAAYEKGPHAIKARRAYFDQWRTVGHELGHAFFFAAGFNPDPNEMAVVVKAVYPGGQVPAKTEIPEGFAEFFMLWFADNAEARKLAPNTAREMEKYLNANPEIQEVFDQCKAIAEEDLLGTPLERMRHLTVRRGARLAPATGEYEVPWWKRLTFRFADASIPLRDLYEEASSKGYDGLDPAKLYAIWGMAREQANQLFAGKPRFKWGGFVLPGKRSLQEIVEEAAKRPNGVMLFNDIYKALRYQERAEKGFVTPYPKEEFDKIVEQAEKDYPDLVKLVKEYAENLSEINLRLLVAGEVVSEETADRIRKGSKYYLPLYYPAKGQVRGTAQDPMRSSGPGVLRYKGHTAQTLDFIEATLLRLHDTIQAVEINRMMKTIEESLKMPEMGRFGVFIERPVTVRGINLGNLTRQIEDNFLGELDPDDEGRVVRLFMPGLESDLKKSEPVVVARHGDKQVFMRLAPDLFEAVQSMRPIQYNWLMKVLTMLAQVSRFGALANIRYLTNAFVRDVVASGIQSKTTFERSMIKGFVKGALTAAGLGKDAETLFDLYIQSGAYGSAVQEVLNSMRRSVTTDGLMATPAPGWKRTAKNIFVRIVNAPMDALRILEEAPRIPEFEAVLKKELAKHDLTIGDLLKGNIPEDLAKETEKALIEAAYASREVVVNFGLAGTSMGWRKYTRTVPFLQGSVQGIYRAYRQIKTDPAGTMVRWLVYVLPVTLIAWALSHDDDRYKDMPSDARDAYWWFPVGKATFIALAKPYEYALPANILERFLDWLADSDDPNRRKPLEDLIAAVKKSFGVQPTSMVVNTIWDLARNKTFYGSPIVPQREMQVSPEYRYGPETKKASIKLAQIAALFMGEKAPSPRQIDYFMRGAFGGAGETFLDLLSLPLKGPGSEKRAGIEYVPIVGPLLYGPAEGGSRIVDRFYKDYDRAQKLYNDYRLHGKELSEREARLVAAIPAMRAIADNLANLRRELREIEMDPNTTPERKRQARLRYNWISRMAAGYLYGAPVPEAPPETGFTEAHVQDYLRHYDGLVEKAIKNAKKKPGGPV